MPRIIQLSPQTRLRRRRCHVGVVMTFEFCERPDLPKPQWSTLDRMSSEGRILINVINRLVPLDESQGDDPCIVEAQSPAAAELPACCAPSARLYINERDRAIIRERTEYGIEMIRSLGGQAHDPEAAWMNCYRNAILYTLNGPQNHTPHAGANGNAPSMAEFVERAQRLVVTPEELCAHAVEIVYVASDAPAPLRRFEILRNVNDAPNA